MSDPVFYKYSTQQVRLSTSFSYNYSVGPTYLLPFQVSVDMFVLGCRVEPLRFAPFLWVKPNSNSNFPDYIQALTSSTLHSHSMNTFNTIIQSVQNPLILLFTIQQLKIKLVQNHRLEVYSPGYFHTTHSVNNYLHQIHFPFQMSQPTIVKCYKEITEDMTLLCLFSLEEYSSLEALPCLGAL